MTTLAGSSRSEDQAELASLLSQAPTLDQLDPPAQRDRSRAADLRVAAVLARLQTNRSSGASLTLVALAASKPFNESWQRQELLVRATIPLQPLPPQLLAYLDSQSQPDSVNLHIAINAMADNGSEQAIQLLGRKLADAEHESAYKLGWIRDAVLRHRRDLELLRAAEVWLQPGKLDPELQDALAGALFEYRPHEWFPGREGIPRPPSDDSLDPEISRIVCRIGKHILSSTGSAELKASVGRTLQKLKCD